MADGRSGRCNHHFKACSGIAKGVVMMADVTFASLVVASPQGTLYFRTLAPNTLFYSTNTFHDFCGVFQNYFMSLKRVIPGEESHQPSSTNYASFLKVSWEETYLLKASWHI